MILFLLGFLSAVVLVSITLILYALRGYHQQERQRQASVDAIMAKVAAGQMSVNEARSLQPTEARTKGIH